MYIYICVYVYWYNKMYYTYFIVQGILVNNNNQLFMSDVTVLPSSCEFRLLVSVVCVQCHYNIFVKQLIMVS